VLITLRRIRGVLRLGRRTASLRITAKRLRRPLRVTAGFVVRASRPHVVDGGGIVQARSGFAFGYAVTGQPAPQKYPAIVSSIVTEGES
jgi:hypothetical protein